MKKSTPELNPINQELEELNPTDKVNDDLRELIEVKMKMLISPILKQEELEPTMDKFYKERDEAIQKFKADGDKSKLLGLIEGLKKFFEDLSKKSMELPEQESYEEEDTCRNMIEESEMIKRAIENL